jgi:hypothetical protein
MLHVRAQALYPCHHKNRDRAGHQKLQQNNVKKKETAEAKMQPLIDEVFLRRQQDLQGAHRSKVAREVHGHLLAYHAARGLLDLLSPNTPGDPDGDILEAASALFERSLTLRDARIEALARLAFALASDPQSASRDIALMTSTLEDLLMLLNRRLDRAARRIEANFDADSTQGTPEWSH